MFNLMFPFLFSSCSVPDGVNFGTGMEQERNDNQHEQARNGN